jgi:hypothetical protein
MMEAALTASRGLCSCFQKEVREMRKEHKSATFSIFIGILLVVIFFVGMAASKRPDTFMSKYYVDTTLDLFVRFCAEWWIPAGIIGIPLFLISLVLSLWRESKENRK